MNMKRFLAALGFALLSSAAGAQPLTVSAAASLKDAFIEIGQRFEAAHPGVPVRFNFGASSVLLQQIEQGAPADVFASADEDTLRRGIERKLLDSATRRDFAANALVLVVPAGEGGVRALADLQVPSVKRIAVGKPVTVPAGRYAQQALKAAGLWPALEAKLIPADNVRQVLDYVARGEADAGFVYRTDAAIAGAKLRVVQAVEGHDPVRYPAAVVADGRNKAMAMEFVGFLAAPAAQEVLARHGFSKP